MALGNFCDGGGVMGGVDEEFWFKENLIFIIVLSLVGIRWLQ